MWTFWHTWRRIAFGVLLATFATEASSCAVCLSGITVTPGQRIDGADRAVLALPLGADGPFQVVEVIKGDIAVGEVIAPPDLSVLNAELVTSQDDHKSNRNNSAVLTKKPLLLVDSKLSAGWTAIGEIDVGYTEWLRAFSAHKPLSNTAWPIVSARSSLRSRVWAERLALMSRHLESNEPLVAAIAYGELARAPYEAIRTLRPKLDAQKIAGWTKDPRLSARLSGYTVLMGIAGDSDYAKELEQKIETALQTGNSANLSAMLVADLELRGESRIAWIEQAFFVDRQRTLPEIEAALQALSVHGGADAMIPRARVVEAYCNFIRARRQMAGFVAMELADWQAWEAISLYLDVIGSKAVSDPAGEFAILSYLQQSRRRNTERRLQPSNADAQ